MFFRNIFQFYLLEMKYILEICYFYINWIDLFISYPLEMIIMYKQHVFTYIGIDTKSSYHIIIRPFINLFYCQLF